MREIKFRAWNGKEMVDPFIPRNEDWLGPDVNELIDTLQHEWNYKLMQYTGLKDKNGKKIYKGDILQINDEEHEGNAKIVCVEYKRGGFVDSYFHRYIGDIKTYKIEIIGNKYENPELLT